MKNGIKESALGRLGDTGARVTTLDFTPSALGRKPSKEIRTRQGLLSHFCGQSEYL